MFELLAGLEANPVAVHLRASRWTYPLVNAAHILGVALLVGAVAPLDLRLIGLWPHEPIARLAAVLRPVAVAGAALAFLTGLLLFSVNAREYAAMPLFWIKMTLLAFALANAALHVGPRLLTVTPARQRAAGAASLALWIVVLVCGRLLGYV